MSDQLTEQPAHQSAHQSAHQPADQVADQVGDQPTLLVRISRWVRRHGSDGSSPLPLESSANEMLPVQTRPSKFFRPFAKRDAAIANLQRGFDTLNELMRSIREAMDRNGRRQDEMISYLSRLPEVLETMPEAQKSQGEGLRSLANQLTRQVEQHNRLAEILERLASTTGDHREGIDNLNDRVERLSAHSQAISESLRQVGTSMENSARSSDSSSQVLRQLQDNLNTRDQGIEGLLRKQNSRMTALLVTAVVLSVLAILSAAAVGWFALQ